MKSSSTMLRWLSWLLVLMCLMSMAPVGLAAGEGEPEQDVITVTIASPAYDEADPTEDLEYVCVEIPAEEVLSMEDAGELEDAGAVLREAMATRQSTAFVEFWVDEAYDTVEKLYTLSDMVYAIAISHTGVPNEGDYIRWNGPVARAKIYYGKEFNGRYYHRISYELSYYTTAAQEAAVDAEVDRILEQLDLWEASDYEKVKGIYDYICDTVTYDFDNLEDATYTRKYTSYAAFIDKNAVCQGYATMFYRLALELGVDARVIAGIGNGGPHAWNIVELGGQYYNLDVTWDAGRVNYSYFLRAAANFGDHTRDEEFETVEFHANYPTSTSNYKASLDPADGLLASGTCGASCSWSLRTDNILRITGTGDMYDYTSGNAPWQSHAYRIQGIEMDAGITKIGRCAFYNCKALGAVTIPGSVKTVGAYAFYGCAYLSAVTFRGYAPAIGSSGFGGVTATAYYYNNGSWNASTMLNYGGTLTWSKLEGCTVQFQNWNGDVISTWIGGLGDVVTVPDDPVRPADETYTYTFSGWDKTVVNCDGNAIYIATYSREYIDYTIVFRNADNAVISSKTYHYGDAVTAPDAPKPPASVDQSFVFKGWDKEVTPCLGDAIYTAVFEGEVSAAGDFDGDGVVTDSDVIWLLWYTVFPEDYPLSGDADFDGDGVVTDADVIWLLWHTVFPEDYPLN